MTLSPNFMTHINGPPMTQWSSWCAVGASRQDAGGAGLPVAGVSACCALAAFAARRRLIHIQISIWITSGEVSGPSRPPPEFGSGGLAISIEATLAAVIWQLRLRRLTAVTGSCFHDGLRWSVSPGFIASFPSAAHGLGPGAGQVTLGSEGGWAGGPFGSPRRSWAGGNGQHEHHDGL